MPSLSPDGIGAMVPDHLEAHDRSYFNFDDPGFDKPTGPPNCQTSCPLLPQILTKQSCLFRISAILDSGYTVWVDYFSDGGLKILKCQGLGVYAVLTHSPGVHTHLDSSEVVRQRFESSTQMVLDRSLGDVEKKTSTYSFCSFVSESQIASHHMCHTTCSKSLGSSMIDIWINVRSYFAPWRFPLLFPTK